MIKKIDGKYVVLSEATGRRFGTYDTLAEAERRLRPIEFFKHVKAWRGRAQRCSDARYGLLGVASQRHGRGVPEQDVLRADQRHQRLAIGDVVLDETLGERLKDGLLGRQRLPDTAMRCLTQGLDFRIDRLRRSLAVLLR